jgi:hypothetical protein
MNESVTSAPSRTRRPGRRTLLLSATLVASAVAGCPGAPGVVAGVVPPPPSPRPVDSACTDPQKADAGVVKCCVQVARPDSQRLCRAEEQLQPNRCCPE